MIEDHIKFDHSKIKMEDMDDYCEDNIEDLLSLLAKNGKGEQNAIKDYFDLLDICKNLILPDEYKDMISGLESQIREFISDELQHSQKINEYIILISGIAPAKD